VEEAAENAASSPFGFVGWSCCGVGLREDKDSCVYDVLATDDLEMALQVNPFTNENAHLVDKESVASLA
jgi:hypothetical protein